MTHRPVLAIVTVTYNSAIFLPDFLNSLLADDSVPGGFRLYLIDNASSDETTTIARSYADRLDLVLIENDADVGFSVGSNQGVALALGAGAKWIMLLNDDTIVPRGTLAGLVETATTRNLRILSPVIEEIPSNTIWYAGGSITPRQGMKVRHQSMGGAMTLVDPGVRPTQYASGCCLLIHRDVFARIGGLDEDYFVYFEDVDFAIRAKAAGFEYWITASQTVLHKASSSTGGYLSPFTIRCISRNWVLTARKHCPIPQRLFALMYMQIWMVARMVLRRDTPAQYLLRERSFLEGLRMPITSRHGNVSLINQNGSSAGVAHLRLMDATESAPRSESGTAGDRRDRLHVIMVTNVIAPDKLGGLERYVRELSNEMGRQGHAVTVICKKTETSQADVEYCADGVRVRRYRVPSKADPLFAVKYPFAVIRGVRNAVTAAIDGNASMSTIVHGHFPLPMMYFVLRRTPYIYTCHAPVYKEILDERQNTYVLPVIARRVAVALFRAVERAVFRSAHRIVTLSDFVAEEVSVVASGTSIVPLRIPGGLDTEWFSPAREGDEPREFGGPKLFTARRLVNRTGVDELIRAMPLIRGVEPTATLTVAGDGPLAARLQELVEELDLRNAVRLLGHISETELRDQYRGADIAVTPTRNLEGFGLSTVEAMACGTVPLVTPVGANREVVGRVSDLLVTPAADPRGIADGVLRLWRSHDFYSIGGAVRDAVHPSLGWSSVCAEYLDLYRDVNVMAGIK